jgi:GAF domain
VRSPRKSSSVRPTKRPTPSRPVQTRVAASSVRRRRDVEADVVRALVRVEGVAEALARVARVCVPELAEKCIVDLMLQDGAVRRIEAVHVDASKAENMTQAKHYAPGAGHPVMAVFASGRPSLVSAVGPRQLEQMASDATHLAVLRRFGPKSLMRLPVIVHGRTAAVMTFSIADSARRLTPSDLDFAERIIGRVATALERFTPRTV